MTPIGSQVAAVKYAPFGGTGIASEQTIVAAVQLKKIRVLGYVIMMGAGTFHFVSSTGPVALIGPAIPHSGLAPVFAPLADCGWFETTKGDSLMIVVSNAVPYAGHLIYQVL